MLKQILEISHILNKKLWPLGGLCTSPLNPERLLVGKLWASFASKLRRDAGTNVQREIQGPKATKVKMEP